jgi:alkyl sulfatase BDS1-like metallo-beta-lactamase superfamily hydrolase
MRFLSAMVRPDTAQKYFQPAPEPSGVTYFRDSDAFDAGGVRFELFSVSSGETLDSIAVWLPHEKTLFVGNFLGALYGALPNFYTIRGDRDRSVPGFLRDVQRLIELDAELLVTGHDEPIAGRERIRADLCRIRDAVRYIHDETVNGMQAHKDLHTLMREIKLPDDIKIGEFHGKVSWAVRSIWEEYSGWFHYDSTTSLYGVPRATIDADLAELAGGARVLAMRAKDKLNAGRPLEAIHLLDIALGAEPGNADALAVKKGSLERLLSESGGTNLSEVMWLKSEIAAAEAALAAAGKAPAA